MNERLTERARELVKKARIVKFADWRASYPASVIDILETADQESRYLTNNDLERLRELLPEAAPALGAVRVLREQVIDILSETRAGILSQFPTIAEPGGALYPPIRAESCWRDLWHFLRCTTYGIAVQNAQYSNTEGLRYFHLLYEELDVPLDAMILGLASLKVASLLHCPDDQYAELEPYFDHLIDQLKRFKVPAAART